MPKGKKKANSSDYVRFKGRNDINSSDEDSFNENASVISATSEGTCFDEGGDDASIQVQNDIFEDKIIEAIDGLTQKSVQGRTNCLKTLGTSFAMKYVPEIVMTRKFTIIDCIEKCLKKGRGLEQVAAAELAALLTIQLCSSDQSNNISKDLSPLLAFIANDNSMSFSARSKCCSTLGLLSFCGNKEDLVETMNILEHVFSSSYHKGDGSVPVITQDLAALHCAAISSWSLLLTISDLYSSTKNMNTTLLGELLDSAHLDVRMAAGEAIAVLLERQRSTGNGLYWEVDRLTLEKLQMLATDNDKHRGKKDKKTQRSSFRHILKYVELDEFPNFQIRFGKEILLLDSWSKKKQYDAFCEVLCSGMNLHLGENDFLRDIMDLGEKITTVNFATQKQTKLARHLMNSANFKVRSITRAKNRDKRVAVFET